MIQERDVLREYTQHQEWMRKQDQYEERWLPRSILVVGLLALAFVCLVLR